MFEILFILILFILTTVSTIISTQDIYKNNKLTTAGIKLLLINFIMLFFVVGQFFYNNYEKSKNEKKLKMEYDSALLVVKEKFDISTVKILETVINGLDNHNLKIDSSNFNISQLIRDSVKVKKYTVYDDGDPIFKFEYENPIYLEKTNNLCMSFQSIDAGSTNFNIEILVAFENPQSEFKIDSVYRVTSILFDKDEKLSANNIMPFSFENNFGTSSNLYFILNGNYTNLSNTKTYYVFDVCYFNPKKNASQILVGEQRQELLKNLKVHHHIKLKYLPKE